MILSGMLDQVDALVQDKSALTAAAGAPKMSVIDAHLHLADTSGGLTYDWFEECKLPQRGTAADCALRLCAGTDAMLALI